MSKPRYTKEMLAAKREFITRGTFLTADCNITTPFSTKSRAETPLEEAIRRMAKVRVQLAAALRQRH